MCCTAKEHTGLYICADGQVCMETRASETGSGISCFLFLPLFQCLLCHPLFGSSSFVFPFFYFFLFVPRGLIQCISFTFSGNRKAVLFHLNKNALHANFKCAKTSTFNYNLTTDSSFSSKITPNVEFRCIMVFPK